MSSALRHCIATFQRHHRHADGRPDECESAGELSRRTIGDGRSYDASVVCPARLAAWQDVVAMLILLSALIVGLVFSQVVSAFGPYVKNGLLLPQSRVGLLLAVNTILIVLAQMPLTHGAERFSKPAVACAGALLLALGFGLMPLGSGCWFLAFTIAIWTFGEMLCMPSLATLISLRADQATLGKYLGLFGTAFGVGMMVGPACGACLEQIYGWNVLWCGVAALCTLIAVLMILVAGLWRKDARRASRARPRNAISPLPQTSGLILNMLDSCAA